MTEPVKLSWQDVCQHEPHCVPKSWMKATVPDYKTYYEAHRWLREERNMKVIPVEAEVINPGHRYTGRYIFKFLCEQEYVWFVLKWS